MKTRTCLALLLFAALGPAAMGTEISGAIWWAPEARGGSGGGGKQRGGAAGMPGGPRAERPGSSHGKSDESHEDNAIDESEGEGPPAHVMKRMREGGGPPAHVMERMREGGGPPAHVMERMREGGAPPAHVMERMREGGGGPPHGMTGSKSPNGGHPGSGPGKPGGDSGEGAMPSRASMMAAMRKPKTILLQWGSFPETQGKESELGQLIDAENVEAWIRIPDGSIVKTEVKPEKDTLVTKCPPESKDDAELPNGVYVVGMHLDAGVMDFDSDGRMERVHFYSNGLSTRFSRDGETGEDPGVLFEDADKMALEIGPVTAATGRGGFMATSQTAMEENKLQVFFRGKPLANAEVTVLSDSGWRNTVTTDADGILTVVPVGKKSDGRMRMTASDKCLYVVLHKEQTPGELDGTSYETEYHLASLLMGVRMPGPEWTSKSEGLRLTTASGIGFLILAGTVAMYRRRRRARQIMIEFDRYRIPGVEQ